MLAAENRALKEAADRANLALSDRSAQLNALQQRNEATVAMFRYGGSWTALRC